MTFCGWVLGGGKGWGSLELCCLQHLVQVTWHWDMNRLGWLTWKFRFCKFYSISDIWTVTKRPRTEIHQVHVVLLQTRRNSEQSHSHSKVLFTSALQCVWNCLLNLLKRSGYGSNVIETVKEIGGIFTALWDLMVCDRGSFTPLAHGNGRLMCL